MIPGHPAGSWRYEGECAKRAPTPAELGEMFDEQDTLGELSADSWLALRRLAEGIGGEPIQYGPLVCRPDADEFRPDMLEGEITSERLDALTTKQAQPTSEEIAMWQAAYMQRAHMDDAPGLFVIHAWTVSDDKSRQRILVTLHGDQGTFERVAGLFMSIEEAAEHLGTYGDFEWLW